MLGGFLGFFFVRAELHIGAVATQQEGYYFEVPGCLGSVCVCMFSLCLQALCCLLG